MLNKHHPMEKILTCYIVNSMSNFPIFFTRNYSVLQKVIEMIQTFSPSSESPLRSSPACGGGQVGAKEEPNRVVQEKFSAVLQDTIIAGVSIRFL